MLLLSSRLPERICTSVARRSSLRNALLTMLTALATPLALAATTTSTVLTISSSTVAYKTPVILTASVTAGGSPVSSGLVLFCDASAPFCTSSSALGTVQLTSNATAILKLGSGPLGTHSYKAVYRPNNFFGGSSSDTVSYSVQGTYASATSVAATGAVGAYTLTAAVIGVGSPLTGPTGTVSLLDTSTGNSLLGVQPLAISGLSQAFTQAANSPFSIGTDATTRRSVALASAYLNADNNVDVVTGDAQGTITVLMGNGDGTFQPKVTYPGCATGRALKIILADFNRDGNTDVALGCSDGTNGSLTILLGNGDGSFKTPVPYTAGDVAGMAIGDFNGDGILDFAVTNRVQQNVMIFTGNGDGTFASQVTALTTSAQVHDIVAADFNGDGKDDVVYAVNTAASGSSLSDLYLAPGNGDSTFHTGVLIASKVGEFLTVGDTNADGFPDLVSTTITGTPPNIGNSLFVLIGRGDGTFQPTATYVSDIPSDPHLADVNGDGKPDIIAGGSYGALVYIGNGDGTFKPYNEPTIGNFSLTYAVNAGDFNNDGNADLIGTDANTPRAAISLSEVRQTTTASALTGIAVFPLGSGVHNIDASYTGDSMYIPSLSSTVPLVAAPTPTTLSLVPFPSAATLPGQSIRLTATLSPYAVGPPSTTTNGQTVQFFSGATALGSANLIDGVAVFTTSTLPVGTDPLTATFAGDANYNPSSSSTVTVTVSNIVLASSSNPSTYSQTVTFVATVVAGETGTVTFKDGATVLGTATISGTTAIITTSALTSGSHEVTGIYSGDSTHSTAISPVLIQQVDKFTPLVTVSTSGPSTFSGSVSITASVPAGTTGLVTFTSGGVTLGSGTPSPSGSVTIATSTLPAGSDVVMASYAGDENNNPSTGTVTQIVAKASPPLPSPVATPNSPTTASPVTITESVPTGVSGPVSFFDGTALIGTTPIVNGVATLTVPSLPIGPNTLTASTPGDANNNPATSVGVTITVVKATPTVLVTTTGPSTYGGTVSITANVPVGINGDVTFTSGGVTLGTATVNAAGSATISTTALPTGPHIITASYSGDTNNNPASGSAVQTVGKISPIISVATSGSTTFGDPVTVTVTAPPGITGLVTLTSGGATLGSGTVSPAGTVVITSASLPAGTDSISANYAGDVNTNPASASTTQIVAKSTPISILSSSLNPSTVGTAVTFTDTVPNGATGAVTFSTGGTVLGTGTISNGVAVLTTSALSAGQVPIVATYNGDSNHNPSVATLAENVSKATPTLTISTSGSGIYGTPLTITATAPVGATGNVTFASGGVTLGSGSVNASGTVTITTSSLPVGSDTLSAIYAGDTNYNPATGTAAASITKATPAVTLNSSANPAVSGQAVIFTATVPTGTTGVVTFFDGATVLGTGAIVNGVASFTTSALTADTHSITASYGGDTNNTASTSAPLTEIINKLSPTLAAPAVSSTSVDALTPVMITEVVPAGVTGTVSFYSGQVLLGTAPIVNGTASLTAPSLPVGTDSITAATAPDPTHNGATSPSTDVTVSKITPQLTAPVLSATNVPAGTPVTISETVPAGVTGTVTFMSGSTVVGTAPVVNGVATLTTTSLPVGTDPITAVTPAGPIANPATSPSAVINVTKAVATLALSSSANPSVIGQPVTFTAVANTGATGTITFLEGTTVIGMGNLNASSVATFTTSSLTAGSHTVTSAYGGDINYTAVSSAAIVEVISKAPTAITLTQSTSAELLNTVVTFAAQVTASTPTPTGSVIFMDGTTVLTTVPFNSGSSVSLSSSAVFPTGALAAGPHQITAVYSGDSTFAGSSTLPVTNTVNDFSNVLKGVATQNMFPGGSTSYTFTLTPIGDTKFLGDLALKVDGLPAGTTYSFSTPLIVAGSGATTVTLNLQTSAALSAENRKPSGGLPRSLPASLAILGVVGIGTVRRHRRHMPRLLAMLLLSAASLLPIASLTGCAGGYFALTPNTYNLSVTGTEGTIQHTATATLIVQ